MDEMKMAKTLFAFFNSLDVKDDGFLNDLLWQVSGWK